MKVSVENQAQRRDVILLAAEGVFGDCGYSATTMEAVADKAGISKGSIYNYFQNKQDLFQHLFARAFSEYEAEAVEVLGADNSAGSKIETLLEFWFRRLNKYQHLARLVLEFWATAARQQQAGGLADTLREMYAQWRSRLAALLSEGVASGEFAADLKPHIAASLIMAILDGIEVQSLLDIGLVIDEEFVTGLKHAVLAGLKGGA